MLVAVRTSSRRIAVQQFSQSLGPNNAPATTTTTTTKPKHPFFEQTINVNSRPTLVVQSGYIGPDGAPSPDKTLLLTACSVGTAISDYRGQLEELPRLLPAGWSVVGWDQPGRGKSKRDSDVLMPLDYFERTAQLGIDVMETLGVKRYAVMGYSSGGAPAMIMAAQRPQNVRALICSNVSTHLHLKDYYQYYKIRETGNWPEPLRKPFEDEYGAAELKRLWLETVTGYKAIALASDDGNVCEHLLSKIQCPTLLMHGEKDPLVKRVDQLKICQLIANCELMEMVGGRHNMHIARPDEFNRLVAEWMRRSI